MRSRSFVARLSLVLSLTMGAQAQTAQCSPGWEWNQNSLDQDPCTVVSMLGAFCRGQLQYVYQKISNSQYYLPPSKNHTGDLTCDCNSVVYSLTMACATCQEATAYGWVAWETECGSGVYVTVYPGDIPQGTRVPLWAFYNVTTLSGQEYTDKNAESVGRDPEATPSSITTLGEPSATGAADGNSSSGGVKTAAIVGGVVGGVGALIITSITVYFVVRCRRRKREKYSQPPYRYQRAPINHWTTRPNSLAYDPSVSTGPTVRSNVPLQPYNPAGPSTFQSSIPQGQTNQFPHRSSVTYVTPISNSGARR